jgi:hypothetical protein
MYAQSQKAEKKNYFKLRKNSVKSDGTINIGSALFNIGFVETFVTYIMRGLSKCPLIIYIYIYILYSTTHFERPLIIYVTNVSTKPILNNALPMLIVQRKII